ncbi:hypothetical protein [Peptoniphilus sp.]|uniref:hypothetical protein n=1 Tax=Peptoniphilus sp. TaxID=1971214 RepID=UPI003D943209
MKVVPTIIKFAIAHKFAKNKRRKNLKRNIRKQIFKHPVAGSKILYRASRIKFRNTFLK